MEGSEKYVEEVLDESEQIVSMTEHNGIIYVATNKNIYTLNDGKYVKRSFQYHEEIQE